MGTQTRKGPKDAARMRRILAACGAPKAVRDAFDGLCAHWSAGDQTTAEQLLLDACRRFNYVEPWRMPGVNLVFRPYSLPGDSPDRHADSSGTPAEEQSYRRGFDQGAASVVQMLKAGTPLAEVEASLEALHRWRVQPIQEMGSWPGTPYPQTLPDRWRDV